MNTLQKAAEILVECGYADQIFSGDWIYKLNSGSNPTHCEPFSDTLEGRRQADAIEDWLWIERPNLWTTSIDSVKLDDSTGRKSRLNRIEWCLNEIT